MKARVIFLGCIGIWIMVVFTGSYIRKPTPYPFPNLPYFPMPPDNFSNPVTVEGAQLGRYLFYDPILSRDSSISCASCHRQEQAFSDGPNAFSLGINRSEMTKNTMPLFNLAWYEAYFWNGRAPTLEDQIFEPVSRHDEMGLSWPTAKERIKRSTIYPALFLAAFGTTEMDSVMIAHAIAQFERTLISHQSKYDRVLQGLDRFSDSEYQGYLIVNDQSMGNCLHCHVTDAHALGTTGRFANNGLSAQLEDSGRFGVTGLKADNGKFQIPSLRNLSFTAPYMHDGRFLTLAEVIDFYSEGIQLHPNIDAKMAHADRGGMHFTPIEKKQIKAFLETLNDSVFVTDQAFGNPFE